MRFLLALILLSAVDSWAACVVSVTAPTASSTINGDGPSWQYSLTSTQAGCTAVYSVEYDFDGELEGVSRTSPFTFVSNPYHLGNGSHNITAIARNVKNTILGTSSAVAFSVENNLPQNTCATTCTDISVTSASVAPITFTGSTVTGSTISFFGSGSVAPVTHGGHPYCANPSGTLHSLTLSCGTTTAGNLLAIYVAYSAGGTGLQLCVSGNAATCSNTGLTNGTINYVAASPATADNYTSGWIYVTNLAGGTTTVNLYTCTSGSGPTCTGVTTYLMQGAIAYEISGADLSAPLDVNVSGTTSGVNPVCKTSPYTLSHSAADELVLAGCRQNGTGATITRTNGPWSAIASDSTVSLGVEYINPPSTFYGTMDIGTTVNGPNSGISKVFYAFVDGLTVGQSFSTTAATQHLQFDTTSFSNGSHNVVEEAIGGNCPGCMNGTWGSMGEQEQQQTFSNGASPSWLQLSAGEVTLCTMAQTNCPTVATITGTDINTDGSTTAATISTCLSGTPAVVIISGTCTVNQVALGSSVITVTDSTKHSTTSIVNVLSANTLPHFLSNGTTSTSYVACPANPCSIWRASLFFSSEGFQPINTTSSSYAPIFGPLLANGFNAFEDDPVTPAQYANASAWQAGLNTQLALDQGYVNSYGLKGVVYVADPYFRGTPEMFDSEYGTHSTWGPGGEEPWQYVIAQLATAGNPLGVEMVDEVVSSWGGNPLAGVDTGGITINTSYLSTPLSCISGTVCTVTTSNVGLNGAHTFIITGSTDSNLNNIKASGVSHTYSASQGFGTFTFSTPSGVGTHNYTNVSDPGLTLEPYVFSLFDSSYVACPPNGASAGPCPNYIHYDIFKNIRNQTTATMGHVGITWPSVAGSTTNVISNWCGNNVVSGVKLADYCTAYWSSGAPYLPTKVSLKASVFDSMGNSNVGIRRAVYPYMDTQTPFIVETSGTMNSFTFQGYGPMQITSCSGNTINFTSPHGLTAVIPEVTRLTVSGSTACDGNYYVISIASSTALLVVLANGTFFSSQLSTPGTITTQDSTVISIAGIQNNVGSPANQDSIIARGSGCSQLLAKAGQTFTTTSYSGGFATMVGGWLSPASVNSCSTYALWRQIPNLSSTGGTARIIPDNYFHRGVTWQSDSDTGPEQMFASGTSVLLYNGAGVRHYAYLPDTQLCDVTIVNNNGCYFTTGAGGTYIQTFGGTDLLLVQGGTNPLTDVSRSIEAFQAGATYNQLAERLVPYAFQQRLAAPDYGRANGWYEASARTGSLGNLLMIQGYLNSSESCTTNLTPYLVGGQSIIRISGTWAGIEPIVTLSPGTTSDTMTCQPGEFRAYLFPNNAAAELNLFNVTVNIASVMSAAGAVVQYSYTPFPFNAASVSGRMAEYQTMDCGAGPNCAIPADLKIGPIYYRILYYDSSNAVLSTSSVLVSTPHVRHSSSN